eukprot:GGOE01047499.1.p1 GENE.GGOE01047499.1~~GGOE01047499.1.p1  ORF type:complete len:618 (-),score=60.81 GGOE01047499.1:423-2276(-)
MTPPKNVVDLNPHIQPEVSGNSLNSSWASTFKSIKAGSKSIARSKSVIGLEGQRAAKEPILSIPFVSFGPDVQSPVRDGDTTTKAKRPPLKSWNQGIERDGASKSLRNRSMSVPSSMWQLATADGASTSRSSMSWGTSTIKESSLLGKRQFDPPSQRRGSKSKAEVQTKQALKQSTGSIPSSSNKSEARTPSTSRLADTTARTTDGSSVQLGLPGPKAKAQASGNGAQEQELYRGTRSQIPRSRSTGMGLNGHPSRRAMSPPSRRAMSPPPLSSQQRCSSGVPRRSASMVTRKQATASSRGVGCSAPGSRSASPFDGQPLRGFPQKPSVNSSPISSPMLTTRLPSPHLPGGHLSVDSPPSSRSPIPSSRPSSGLTRSSSSTPVPLTLLVRPEMPQDPPTDAATSTAPKSQPPLTPTNMPKRKDPKSDTWFKGCFIRMDGQHLCLVCPRCEQVTCREDALGCMLDCHDVLCHACCEDLLQGRQTLCCPCCRRDTPLMGRALSQLVVPRVVSALLEIKREDLYTVPLETLLEDAGAVCPVCLEVIGVGRMPILLNCGHNLCDECSIMVQARASAEDHVECPECRQLTPHGADSVNLVLMYLVAQLRTLKVKGPATDNNV